MCLSPRRMVNPTKCLRQSDKFYLDVPCNECSECRKKRKKSFELRLLSEMRAKSASGYTFCFGTLTYNDDHLPYIEIYRHRDEDEKDYNVICVGDKEIVLFESDFDESEAIPCFDKQHIIDLFTYIRKYYTRDGADENTPVFLVAAEFGSHTQRPHYHFVLGCKDTAENMHDLVKHWWCETHDFGFLFPRRYEGNEFNNGRLTKPFEIKPATFLQSAKYVAKYCCKDLSFYNVPVVKRFETFLKSNPTDDNKRIARYHLPFVHCSRKLGYSLLSYVHDVNDIINGIKLENYDNLVPLPSLLVRNLIYKRRTVKDDPSIKVFEDGKVKYKYRYDLTDLGKEYLLKSLKTQELEILSSLRQFVRDVTLNSVNAFRTFYVDSLGYSSTSYNNFIEKVKTIETLLPRIAMFSTYYHNRLSLFHLELLNRDSAIFKMHSDCSCRSVSLNGRVFPYTLQPEFEVYNGVKVVERFTLDGDDVGYLTFSTKRRPLRFRSSNVMPLFDSVDDIQIYGSSFSKDSLFFCGNETYQQMYDNRENFIKEYFDYNRYIDENKVDMTYVREYFNVLTFNNFPCFSGYSEFLNVFNSWITLSRSIASKMRDKRETDITHIKQSRSE